MSFLLIFLTFMSVLVPKAVVFAEDEQGINYIVYDTDMKNILFERIDVAVGDIFIDKEFRQYKVYLVDEREHYAKAEQIGQLKRRGLTKKVLKKFLTKT